MKKKIVAMVGVLALGASLAIAAPGEGRGGKRHGKHGAFGQKFAEKLNLTDAQRQQIEQIRKSTRENNAPLFESFRALREEKRAAKQANDTARLEALKGRAEALRAQMKQVREAEKAQIVSVLTPEQKAQFEAMKNDRRGKRGARGQRGAQL